jgi:hypothetical protein
MTPRTTRGRGAQYPGARVGVGASLVRRVDPPSDFGKFCCLNILFPQFLVSLGVDPCGIRSEASPHDT